MADDLARMKPQVYRDDRGPEAFEKYHARTRRKGPGPWYEVVRLFAGNLSLGLFRVRAHGTERVPPAGPLILAPNHFSNMDHFFLAVGLRRKVHFLAKSQMFRAPLDRIYSGGGVFPVRRGAGDEEMFTTARTVLGRGHCVGIYCEGGRSRSGALGTAAKAGIGRIALETGATIVPVALHGSSQARNWKRGRFPRVTVLFGPPLRYTAQGVGNVTPADAQAVADEILAEITTLYRAVDSGEDARKAAAAYRPAGTVEAAVERPGMGDALHRD